MIIITEVITFIYLLAYKVLQIYLLMAKAE